jgi:hypothetical protein
VTEPVTAYGLPGSESGDSENNSSVIVDIQTVRPPTKFSRIAGAGHGASARGRGAPVA